MLAVASCFLLPSASSLVASHISGTDVVKVRFIETKEVNEVKEYESERIIEVKEYESERIIEVKEYESERIIEVKRNLSERIRKWKNNWSEKELKWKNVGKICSIKELRGEQRADGEGGDHEGEEAVAFHLVAGPTHRPQHGGCPEGSPQKWAGYLLYKLTDTLSLLSK